MNIGNMKRNRKIERMMNIRMEELLTFLLVLIIFSPMFMLPFIDDDEEEKEAFNRHPTKTDTKNIITNNISIISTIKSIYIVNHLSTLY